MLIIEAFFDLIAIVKTILVLDAFLIRILVMLLVLDFLKNFSKI